MSSPGSDSSGSFISTKSRGEDDGGGRVVTLRHHFAPDVEPYRSSEDEDEDSAAAAAAAAADDDDSEDRFDDAASLPSETGTVELSSDVEVEAEELGGGGGKARRVPPAAAADDDDDDVSEVNGEHGHDEEEDEDGDDEDTTNQDEEEEGELNEPGPMDDGTYTVERIVSKRLNPETDVLEYEVKWVGWPADTNTFEPVAHLLGSEHKIKEFEERRRRLAAKRREKERLLLRKRAAAAGRPRRSASASNSAASSDAEAEVAEEDSGAERAPPQEEEEEENARRKAAIARERLELISSAERRIVAVRAISLGCHMRGTRDTFDVVFDDKRCTLLADYELELLSEANRRFLNAYYARRIEEIAELKERAYRENLRLAYSLMPADFPRPDDL